LHRKSFLYTFPFILLTLAGCTKTTLTPPDMLTVNPSTALLLPGQQATFVATGYSSSLQSPVWMVNGSVGGSAATGTIAGGLYTAPATAPSAPVQITVKDAITGVTSGLPATVSFFSSSSLQPGTLTTTNNPQVASYAVMAPKGATVQVSFGTTTAYGLSTWAQPAPDAGGTATVLVAGMRAGTTYHVQGKVTLPGGQMMTDVDNIFSTPVMSATAIPNLKIVQAAGSNTSPGIELIDSTNEKTTTLQTLATDLAGNIIWYYQMGSGYIAFPIKLLPNGHMLVVLNGPSEEIREVDLAGNIFFQLTTADVDEALAAAGLPFVVANFHHDIQKLPNGHYLILMNFEQTITNTPGFSQVIADAILDWDPVKKGIAWSWSTLDHIPLTHAPVSTNDWTHANALIYSPDDGNIVLSMRNQNWVIKINYQDGAGDGKILWHLGPGGDFKLSAGLDPIEWNYGQHYPTFVSPNTAGIIQLMVFNNGNERMVDANDDQCGTTGQIACYSSVPQFQLNETTGDASVVSEIKLNPAFSTCCGDAQVLPNGNIEYDVAMDVNTPGVSHMEEVVPGPTPQLVWQMDAASGIVYRGFRIPSLYPGISWTAEAMAAANVPAVAKGTTP
jgi:arylsulfate sulfotransferase